MIVKCHELVPYIECALDLGQRVRLTVNGTSMLPFIRNGATVELVQVNRVFLGDILLAKVGQTKYVIHRLVKLNHKQVWLRGDSNLIGEGPVFHSALIAKVVDVNWGFFHYNPQFGFAKAISLCWISLYPLDTYAFAFIYKMIMVLRALIRGTKKT